MSLLDTDTLQITKEYLRDQGWKYPYRSFHYANEFYKELGITIPPINKEVGKPRYLRVIVHITWDPHFPEIVPTIRITPYKVTYRSDFGMDGGYVYRDSITVTDDSIETLNMMLRDEYIIDKFEMFAY